MPRLTEAIANTTRVSMDEIVHHTRMGESIHKWVNDKKPGNSEVVLTDATLVYNLVEGQQVLVTQMDFDITTISDSCHFDLVACSAVDGGGTPTAISGHVHGFTEAGKPGQASKERPFIPPMLVKYSDGYRSITVRVNANDANCEINCGWHGWAEAEE